MKTVRRFVLPAVVLVAFCALAIPELQAAPGTGTLYGTDAFNGNLIRMDPTNFLKDPTTGAAPVVGPLGVGPIPSLAVDPLTGIMYAGGGGGIPNIYTVNPATGAATLLGDTGLGIAAVEGLDFNAAGTLYASVNIAGGAGTGADHLAIINKTTGAATVVGPYGSCTGVTLPSTAEGSCTIEGMAGIAFDAAGNLWGSHRTVAAGTPGLYRINVATGAATFVAPFRDASGAEPSGGVTSLQFACNGKLYGGTAFPVPPADDGGDLITINPATGAFSTIGKAVQDASLGALAFQAACPTPPRIPAASGGVTILLALLFAASLAWMLSRRRVE
jgi:uncharacterized protein (TIGR03382 family)